MGAWVWTSLLMLFGLAHGASAAEHEPLDIEPRVAACAACHGHEGRSAEEAYAPSIAGKPDGYLYQQLLNFRDGRRQHRVMQPMLAYLADDYLHEIAVYYAAQRPEKTPRSRNASAETLALGRKLVEDGDPARDLPACRSCHGEDLFGVPPAVPGLIALSPDYLAAQLGAWRTGVRRALAPDCMATIAERLTPAEITAVTAYLADRALPEAQEPAQRAPAAWPMPCGGVE